MSTDIKVPTLGESVTEATIGQWFKKVGDRVEQDETIAELETDKVTVEVPAPSAGVLQEIVAKEGETVEVGALIGTLGEGEGSSTDTKDATQAPSNEAKAEAASDDAGGYGGESASGSQGSGSGGGKQRAKASPKPRSARSSRKSAMRSPSTRLSSNSKPTRLPRKCRRRLPVWCAKSSSRKVTTSRSARF